MISVSDTLERIHTDWNFIETHLFRQIAEIEAHAEEEDDPNADRNLDTFLYKRFEQIADMQRGRRQIFFSARTSLLSLTFFHCCCRIPHDPDSLEGGDKMAEERAIFEDLFHLEDEVLINCPRLLSSFRSRTFSLTKHRFLLSHQITLP